MTLTANTLSDRLNELAGDACPERYVVAFSGGLDSTVLLHALVAVVDSGAIPCAPILAVHVDHGLQEDSMAWASHCETVAAVLGVAYRGEIVRIDACDDGVEAAARRARYDCFERLLEPGDWLMSAHHQDDQGETLLLNLLRGSGPLGLAGIAASRPLGAGRLIRPLLDVSRGELEAYAARCDLLWQEDPSNRDNRFDRNFLRNDVLPLLKRRWPAASARLARSAALAAEASDLLDALAAHDLGPAGAPTRLDVVRLQMLSTARQRNLLRSAIRQAGLPSVPAKSLDTILTDVLAAREDAEPLVSWAGGEVRRYRDAVYLLAPLPALPPAPITLVPGCPVDLGPGVGRLRLERGDGAGIDPALADAGLDVDFRVGGERLRPLRHEHTRKLKTLLQEAGIVPWMRGRIPLILSDERLVAVADLWLSAEHSVAGGYVVHWGEHPSLD